MYQSKTIVKDIGMDYAFHKEACGREKLPEVWKIEICQSFK
jgi:hypothetical protein